MFRLFNQIVNKLRFNCSCPVNHYLSLSLSLSLFLIHTLSLSSLSHTLTLSHSYRPFSLAFTHTYTFSLCLILPSLFCKLIHIQSFPPFILFQLRLTFINCLFLEDHSYCVQKINGVLFSNDHSHIFFLIITTKKK